MTLRGNIGYQYGIEEIENISKIYGSGKGALSARAIKIEDINKITGYNPLKTGDGKKFREGTMNEYDAKLTITGTGYLSYDISCSNGLKLNYIYRNFNYFNENREFTFLEQGETITLTNTYYFYYPTTLTTNPAGEEKGIKTSSREYKMIFDGNKSYWIASNYVLGGGKDDYYDDFVTYSYGFFNVGLNYVRSCRDNYLIYAGGNPKSLEKNILPIVYLNKDIVLKDTKNQINGCTEWKLEI